MTRTLATPRTAESDSNGGSLLELPGIDRYDNGKPIIGLDPQSLYAFGHLIRLGEQLILDQFSRGLVSGTTHTCIGEELTAMAVVRAMNHIEDAVLSNHRNHGHYLTYSGDFVGLVAEIMGREGGVCGGYGGSQHLAYRHFHSNGVQGGMTGIATGLALARKYQESGAIVSVIIGDGTLGQGLLYESMNLASVWDVPLLVVVENNGIAQTTYTRETIGGGIEERGAAFGFSTWRYGDDDPEFFQKVESAVDNVRSSKRPGFLVIDTRRMGPHSKGDDLRDGEELNEIHARDPLAALGCRIPTEFRVAIEERNAAFIESVRVAANASPEAVFKVPPQHIFNDTRLPHEPMSYPDLAAGSNVRQALNAALRHILVVSPESIILGEDLHDPYGGAFKVTQGLSTAFSKRVISTPISEAGITGAAIGLALDGYRPVVEVMFADFLTLGLDQLYNHAVKFPGMFRDMAVPLVIRAPCGGRRGYGPTHSQSPEHLLTSVPGLTVVYGSHRHDMSRLLIDATLRWPYPVLFLEHKLLYGEKQDRADYRELPARAEDVASRLFPTLARGGDEPDVTLVTYGGMLSVVEAAARYLEAEELSVEILVLSLLSPLSKTALIGHLLDRPGVVIVEESHHDFGVSAEIGASLLDSGYTGRFLRIGTLPVPIPSARSLERQVLPDEEAIIEKILDWIQ